MVVLVLAGRVPPSRGGPLDDLAGGAPAARIVAATALADGPVVAESAVPVLVQALEDDYWDVRNGAARALGRLGAPAVPALQGALRKDSYYACIYAARAIEAMPPRTIDLQTALQLATNAAIASVDTERQSWAARALARQQLRAPALVEALRPIYDACSMAAIREPLGTALMRAGPPDPAMLSGLVARIGEDSSAKEMVRSFGADAVPALTGALAASRSKQAAWVVIEILGSLGADASNAVPALVKEVSPGRDQWFVVTACDALARIGPAASEAVPVLAEVATSHGYEDARAAAARALGQIGVQSETVTAALAKASEDPTPAVSEAARAAMKALNSK